MSQFYIKAFLILIFLPAVLVQFDISAQESVSIGNDPNQQPSKKRLVAASLSMKSLTLGGNLPDDGWEEFELLNIDGFFNIVNRGIKRIFCELNGRRFTLTTNPEEPSQGDFIFLIPEQDTVLIDIFPYLNPGFFEVTVLRLLTQGPAGADAILVIGDASAKLKDAVDFCLDAGCQWRWRCQWRWCNP